LITALRERAGLKKTAKGSLSGRSKFCELVSVVNRMGIPETQRGAYKYERKAKDRKRGEEKLERAGSKGGV